MPFIYKPWFRAALRLRGSVIPAILPRTLLCGLFAEFIAILFHLGLPLYIPTLATIIPNVVLGLMLVFRTNTAYERFWEGRKLWGHLVNTTRNLARQIWVGVVEEAPSDRTDKEAALKLLVVFAIATKCHLRNDPLDLEVAELASPSRLQKLQTMNHPALEVAFWISDYLQQQFQTQHLNAYQLNAMQTLINELVNALGGCERILKTPIPMAYAIHLRQLLLLYCLTLPFQLVQEVNLWTGPVVMLISFTLFGIEEIGVEIENPFGRDANDLPLDTICNTMLRNIEDLMTLNPSSETYNPQSHPASIAAEE
ncbi:bestrophin family protein [Leptolyngbya sp. AN02str]|uniref:bestrophin family protein n=1 Tax=Leptolyngbya sp. AN02str TaxID=3423363 RepID=UPI003D32106E